MGSSGCLGWSLLTLAILLGVGGVMVAFLPTNDPSEIQMNKLRNAPTLEEHPAQSILRGMGRSFLPIAGDGHCGFRSMYASKKAMEWSQQHSEHPVDEGTFQDYWMQHLKPNSKKEMFRVRYTCAKTLEKVIPYHVYYETYDQMKSSLPYIRADKQKDAAVVQEEFYCEDNSIHAYSTAIKRPIFVIVYLENEIVQVDQFNPIPERVPKTKNLLDFKAAFTYPDQFHILLNEFERLDQGNVAWNERPLVLVNNRGIHFDATYPPREEYW